MTNGLGGVHTELDVTPISAPRFSMVSNTEVVNFVFTDGAEQLGCTQRSVVVTFTGYCILHLGL